MPKVFSAKLSLEGMRQLTKDLRYYRKYTLTHAIEKFVNDLIEQGIYVAYQNVGEFDGYIGFYKEIPSASRDTQGTDFRKYNSRIKAYLIGKNIKPNIKRWISFDGITEKEINSILMAEYGSGQFAVHGWRGTFPDQTHAYEDAWWYATSIGENGLPTDWHMAKGVRPTMPIHKAFEEMEQQIYMCAVNAFERTTQ